jgi:hypothetical protein
MREIERAHGLTENEFWQLGDGPPEWQALSGEWDRVCNLLHAAAFDEYGEPEMAAMFRDRRAEFDMIRERGRRQVFDERRKRKKPRP